MRTFVLRDDRNAKALWAFLRQNWRALAGDGKPLAVTVQPHKAKRSVDQNKRYWSILNHIAEMAYLDGKQFTADAWHEYFKRLFIGAEDLPGGGTVGISTTILSVAEFTEYMTKVEIYAVEELGLEYLI